MRTNAVVALLALPVLAGCAGPDVGAEALQLGSMQSFEDELQPALAERCGSGGCHGARKRPFSLYSPGVRRIDPADTYLAEPLTREELESNARQLAGLAQGVVPEDSTVLCKPLSIRHGGCWHGAEDIFLDRTDPDYRRLLRWLQAAAAVDGGSP